MFNHIMIAYKRIITNPLRFLELKKHVHDFPGKTFFPPWLPFQRNLWPFRAQGWRTSSAITVMMISEVRPPATGGRDGSDPMEDSVDYKWWISKIISIVKLHSVHLLAWQFSPFGLPPHIGPGWARTTVMATHAWKGCCVCCWALRAAWHWSWVDRTLAFALVAEPAVPLALLRWSKCWTSHSIPTALRSSSTWFGSLNSKVRTS